MTNIIAPAAWVPKDIDRIFSTVKFYDAKKRWGFLADPEKPKGANPRDIFFHGSQLEKLGINDILAGTKVSYTVKPDHQGRPKAIDLKVEPV